MKGKILSLKELESTVANLKKSGKKIVTTNGAFDLLHIGHTRALEQSKALGDFLIVGLNSDASIKKYKSKLRPIIPEAERAEVLSALACVDYVYIFDDERPTRFLEIVKPNIHTKGEAYDVDKLYETETVLKNGGKIVNTKSPKVSTTEIIERIVKTMKN